MSNLESSIRNLILDMDGVLWHGETPVPGLARFFEQLQQSGINYILATNNARKVASQYSEKLSGFGVLVPQEQILTSAEAAARYVRATYSDAQVSYVVGDSGLRRAMTAQGFKLLPADGFVGDGARADIVVIGFTPYFCYDQLASASYLINHGAHFIGTNPDVTFPTEYGPLPGAGSMLSFVETATSKAPTVLGKPGPEIFEQALQLLHSSPADTVMVGDRLGTDIAGGHAAGLRTILLLSGISTKEDVEQSTVKPDWILDDLQALSEFIRARDR